MKMAGSSMSNYSTHMGHQQQGQPTLQSRRPTDRLRNIEGTLSDIWSDERREEESDAAGVDEDGHRETNAEA
ncbi:uncharacterized protein PHACADRAFT_264875 [Phanerochaete carnosa HHB-10118-sp]|uniref:Uncharacterized protein n=1 Tax=Phanerochaete carnosa (strain HHB-10118-sp) TaxID=650164 RepID=K5VUJ5_PHACS|nr:uncharacterized protein PHACADRAFT_264875 [Phanerochaete carnosa HHB-10118-sp]EKM50259.1 hypothetical protein PHACADRAFT_264875 [Phanerochaete carnosa HHB-10118-sp]